MPAVLATPISMLNNFHDIGSDVDSDSDKHFADVNAISCLKYFRCRFQQIPSTSRFWPRQIIHKREVFQKYKKKSRNENETTRLYRHFLRANQLFRFEKKQVLLRMEKNV